MPRDFVYMNLGSREFRFTRRKYSSHWFCWVELRHDGDWISLGDPWPCRTPDCEELEAAAVFAIGEGII